MDETRPESFEQMAALLQRHGLPAALLPACRLSAALVPDPEGRSRIGGRPRLAEGTPWPRTTEQIFDHNGDVEREPGWPLVHIASLDLADLPEGVRPRELGELSIFMAETNDWSGLTVDEARDFALVFTPAGQLGPPTEPPADVPDPTIYEGGPSDDPDRRGFRERPLRARPVVALPYDPDSGEAALDRLLTADERARYDALDRALLLADPHAHQSQHAVFGTVARSADGAAEWGDDVVLQLSSSATYFVGYDADENRDWIFGDVFTLLLTGNPEAFRAGRFGELGPGYWTGSSLDDLLEEAGAPSRHPD